MSGLMSGPSNRPHRCTPVGPDRIHGVARSPGRRTTPPQPSCCSGSSDFDETMIPLPSPKINNSPQYGRTPHSSSTPHAALDLLYRSTRTPLSTACSLTAQEQGPLCIAASQHLPRATRLFAFKALEHVSQLQLKDSLSLHCVTNRGLPFLIDRYSDFV